MTASSMGSAGRRAASLRSAVMESDFSGGRKRSARTASASSHQNQMVEFASPGSGLVNDSSRTKAIDYGEGGLERSLMLHAGPQEVQQQGGFAEEVEQPEEYDYGGDAQALAGAGIDIRNRPREPTESIGGQVARVPVTGADATSSPLGLDAPPVEESQVVQYSDPTAEPEIEVVNRDTDPVHARGGHAREY